MSRRLAVFVSLVFAFAAAAQDGRANVTRFNYTGYLAAFTPFLGDEINLQQFDRITAVVSPGSAPMDIVVQRWNGATWVDDGWLLPSALPGPQTRMIDYKVSQSGTYRGVIRTTTWDGTNYIFSMDVSPAWSGAGSGGPANTCFGAIGPDCAFDPVSGNCIRLPSGGLSCYTSVGSQKHDSCCSFVGPTGSMCSFPLPPFPTPGLCSGEWGVATNDVLGNRKWSRFYDPTFVSYQFSSRANREPVSWVSFTSGTANASSFLAPAGTRIRLQDADEGFCIIPSSFLNNGDGTATCNGVPTTPPPLCGAGKKCCEIADDGHCLKCISNTMQCPPIN